MKNCCICGKRDIAIISNEEKRSGYCLECYHKLMANTQGINHNKSNFKFKFTDNEGINREFEMTKMIFSSAVKWLAEEVNGNYKFEVRADIEDNDEFVISNLFVLAIWNIM